MRQQPRHAHGSIHLGSAWRVLALLLVLVLGTTACGGAEDAADADADADTATAAEDPTTEAVEATEATAADAAEEPTEEADAAEEATEEDAAAPDPTSVETVAFINNRAQPLVALTAEEMGLFEEQGLEVEFAELDTGTEAIAAMLGGSADFVTGADARLLQGLDQGLPIVAIGIHNTGFLGNLLVAADNTEVESMQDLAGQRVGVQVGSGVHTAWLRYLDDVGLSEDDFQVTNLSVADMPAAIAGDSIDAALMWQPNAYTSELEGITRTVTTSGEFAEEVGLVYPFYLMTTQQMIDERPEVVQSFVTAWTCSQEWIADHREEAIDILNAEFDGLEREVVEVIFDEVRYTDHQVIDEEVLADLQEQGDKLVETGALGEVPELESGIDNTFVEAALEQGC